MKFNIIIIIRASSRKGKKRIRVRSKYSSIFLPRTRKARGIARSERRAATVGGWGGSARSSKRKVRFSSRAESGRAEPNGEWKRNASGGEGPRDAARRRGGGGTAASPGEGRGGGA